MHTTGEESLKIVTSVKPGFCSRAESIYFTYLIKSNTVYVVFSCRWKFSYMYWKSYILGDRIMLVVDLQKKSS